MDIFVNFLAMTDRYVSRLIYKAGQLIMTAVIPPTVNSTDTVNEQQTFFCVCHFV